MITPACSLTATERVLPRLALDFTTAVADPRVTTTRALNTATRINSSGLIELVNSDLPRFNFDPTTLVCRGQLIEETRTNLFLNSLIDGTNLTTQSVTLSAIAYTMSFYGSGSVVISGGHSATVTGVGNFPSRKTYTFTPTAGSSTFTVSGDVKFAQIEAGTFATSYIPTTGTSATRNADVVNMTGTNFSSWYNQTEGAFYIKADTYATNQSPTRATLFLNKAGTGAIIFKITRPSTRTGLTIIDDAGAVAADLSGNLLANNVFASVVGSYKQNNFAFADGGSAASTDLAGNVPSALTAMTIGSDASVFQNGHVAKIFYWTQQLTNAEVQAFSK